MLQTATVICGNCAGTVHVLQFLQSPATQSPVSSLQLIASLLAVLAPGSSLLAAATPAEHRARCCGPARGAGPPAQTPGKANRLLASTRLANFCSCHMQSSSCRPWAACQQGHAVHCCARQHVTALAAPRGATRARINQQQLQQCCALRGAAARMVLLHSPSHMSPTRQTGRPHATARHAARSHPIPPTVTATLAGRQLKRGLLSPALQDCHAHAEEGYVHLETRPRLVMQDTQQSIAHTTAIRLAVRILFINPAAQPCNRQQRACVHYPCQPSAALSQLYHSTRRSQHA